MSCPICGKLAAPATLPFCSKRCAQIDLGRWLTGSYRVEVADDPAEDETATPSGLIEENG